MGSSLFFCLCAAPLAALLLACAPATDPGPADPAEEAAGRRAALAHVSVENRTDRRLLISFRPAAAPGEEVTVGEVGPRSSSPLAPLPAGEPVVLVARTQTGEWLALAARSFLIDAEWTWVIPHDAPFTLPGAGPR